MEFKPLFERDNPSPKVTWLVDFYQVWLKLALWKMKMWKVCSTSNNGQIMIRKVVWAFGTDELKISKERYGFDIINNSVHRHLRYTFLFTVWNCKSITYMCWLHMQFLSYLIVFCSPKILILKINNCWYASV